MKNNGYLCVGKVVGSRGLFGELKIETWCDSPEDFCEIKSFFFDVNDSAIEVENLRTFKSQVLMRIKNVNDKAAAERLRGKQIYAFKRDISIAKGSYFIEDLKGCKVYDNSKSIIYGTLKDVFNTGANDIYSVVDANGKEYLVPIIKGTIEKIDLESCEILINPIQGVFDE